MSFKKFYKTFSKALEKGQELANSEKWKSRQIAANNIVIGVSSTVAMLNGVGFSFAIDQSTLYSASMFFVSIYLIGNTYFTVATTKRIGL